MLIAIYGLLHFQRLKYIFRGKITQGFAAHPLDDHRQKKKSRIAVQPFAARLEVQRLLPRNHRQRIVIRRYAVDVYTRQLKQRQVIAQTAGVI